MKAVGGENTGSGRRQVFDARRYADENGIRHHVVKDEYIGSMGYAVDALADLEASAAIDENNESLVLVATLVASAVSYGSFLSTVLRQKHVLATGAGKRPAAEVDRLLKGAGDEDVPGIVPLAVDLRERRLVL